MAAIAPIVGSVIGGAILPEIAGATVAGLSSAALGSALGGGLGTWASTGDVEKGLMSGVMGFGLGSAMGELGNWGGGAVPTGPGTEAAFLPGAAQMAQGANPLDAIMGLGGAAQAAQSANPLDTIMGLGGAAQAPTGGLLQAATRSGGDGMFGGIGRAWEGLTQNPYEALKSTFVDNASRTTLPILGGALGLSGALGQQGQMPAVAAKKATPAPTIPPPLQRNVTYPGQDYQHGVQPEWKFFMQQGGRVPDVVDRHPDDRWRDINVPRPDQIYDPIWNGEPGGAIQFREDMGNSNVTPRYRLEGDRLNNERPTMEDIESTPYRGRLRLMADGGEVEGDEDDLGEQADQLLRMLPVSPDERDRVGFPRWGSAYEQGGYASGGIATAREPGMIRGGGDGMSDSVPGTIDGRERVDLSQGEFVWPADVVSGIGNGSSEAGAAKLHRIMSRIRQARTGMTRQPRPIDAEMMFGVA